MPVCSIAFANPIYKDSHFRSLPNTEDEARKIAELLNPPQERNINIRIIGLRLYCLGMLV